MSDFNYIDLQTGESIEPEYPQAPEPTPTYTEENGKRVWTLEGRGFMSPYKTVTTIGNKILSYEIREEE